jgi:hypothetical protein
MPTSIRPQKVACVNDALWMKSQVKMKLVQPTSEADDRLPALLRDCSITIGNG